MKKTEKSLEFLAISTIIVILGLMLLPNIVDLTSRAGKKSFANELKTIEKATLEQWIPNYQYNPVSFGRTTYRYVNGVNCVENNEVLVEGVENLDYEIVVDNEGKIIRFRATDGNYQYDSGEVDEVTDINNIETVSNLKEQDRVKITCNNKYYMTEVEKNRLRTLCVIEDHKNLSSIDYYYYVGNTLTEIMEENGISNLNSFYSKEYLDCVSSIDGGVEDYNNEVNKCLNKYRNLNILGGINMNITPKPVEDGCYSADTASVEKAYTTVVVNHWKQKEDSVSTEYNADNYELVDRDKVDVEYGETYTPDVKDYDGFVSPAKQSVTSEFDNTEINYFYNRK